jgi:hypothetical protein
MRGELVGSPDEEQGFACPVLAGSFTLLIELEALSPTSLPYVLGVLYLVLEDDNNLLLCLK